MNTVEEIKKRLDIIQVVSRYVELRKAGRNYKALSPFKPEKTPSFIVSPDKGLAYCFATNRGGDMFTFIQEIEGVDFKEAVRILADLAGVPIIHESREVSERRERLLLMHEDATRFYCEQLTGAPLDYLLGRGLTKETITKFRLGYAPDSYTATSAHLRGLQYIDAEILAGGLAGESDKNRGDLYDRFRNRIIFPITNSTGRVVAFTGRIIDDGEPKYLNSPETQIYHKSSILFNYSAAKAAIKEAGYCLVVEGQMDVITIDQAGYSNVVASSGSAWTAEQMKLLRRLSGNIVLCFDSDEAGIGATLRAIEAAQAADVNVEVITLPDDIKDPDELIQRDPQLWKQAIDDRRDYITWALSMLQGKFDAATPLGLRAITEQLLTIIKRISNAVTQEFYLKQVSPVLGVSTDALTKELAKIDQPKTDSLPEESGRLIKKIHYTAEDYLIGLASEFPDLAKPYLNPQLPDLFSPARADLLRKLLDHPRDLLSADLLTEEEGAYLGRLTLYIGEKYSQMNDQRLETELESILKQIKKSHHQRTSQELVEQLKVLKESGQTDQYQKLLSEYNKLITSPN